MCLVDISEREVVELYIRADSLEEGLALRKDRRGDRFQSVKKQDLRVSFIQKCEGITKRYPKTVEANQVILEVTAMRAKN